MKTALQGGFWYTALMLEAIFIGILGLFIGSFLNVVVLRLHAKKQFVSGRSACPHCGHVLGWYELIPVISWVIQRGKCRKCKKSISFQYPLVELTTGAVFALSFMALNPTGVASWVNYILLLIIISGFIVLAVYDLRWYLLPDKVLLPLIFPAAVIAAISAATQGDMGPIYGSVAAAVVFGGAFYSLAAISDGKWMGGGDIKLAFVMGLLLGMAKTALAMLLAFWAAAIIGLLLIGFKLRKRSDQIPFGPFLIGATFVAVFWGNEIIGWYLQTSGLNLL